jgi:hypothetical protein
MTIYRVTPNDVETFTIVTNPVRTFVSSSTAGATGSVYVFARRSSIEKEMAPLSAFIDSTHDDDNLNDELRSIQQVGRVIRNSDSVNDAFSGSFASMISGFMDKVNVQGVSARKQKLLEVIRFTPSTQFSSNTLRKLAIKEQINPYYRIQYPHAHWAYTNYNTVNFFTSSTVPTGSALLYPNIEGGLAHEGYVSGTYSLSGAFSFDFYINPRYQTDAHDGDFKAGTIMHLSSSYALSLVTGSSNDENGRPKSFRIKLQLSHSADVAPSEAAPGAFPNDLTFLSNDFALWHNNWHHVVVRWGTNLVNDGTGSFNIDGSDRGTFVIPSGTVAPLQYADDSNYPTTLVVGNYYEGNNDFTESMGRFFAVDPATRDGLNQMNYDGSGINDPGTYDFTHPLNAELHDLSLKRYYMSDQDISVSASVSPTRMDDRIAFYLPPFFVPESPFRQEVSSSGGILQTPFFEVDGTTDDPFNVALSFGVNGHYINIENYLRDFASNNHPRTHLMTASVIAGTSELREANEFLYDDPQVRRRNLLILPCDDGNFVPSYELLASESNRANFIDDLGSEELSFVHLDNLVSTSSLLFGTDFSSEAKTDAQANFFADQAIGFTPEQPGLPAGSAYLGHVDTVTKAIASGNFDAGIQTGAPLSIYQRTRDPSSNQVTFFDISNLYYGKRILPGSLTISDPSLSGSGGAMSITLKDDGRGNLYRADALSSASLWNSAGNVYYDEGIVLVKNPHLYFYGKEGYELSFRGEQNVHVLKMDIIAPANQMNSSSNPNFIPVHPSGYANDPDTEFVYITGINLHDDNFNVVMKAQLAQPIMKRHGDRIAFKVKYDF